MAMSKLHIVHLYPNEMNTYGDRGNLLTLVRRAEWHGYEPVVHYHQVGDELPKIVDIMLGGGGQDSAQGNIEDDIRRLSSRLHELAGAGTPMLMVCGCYQLFGHQFITQEGEKIKGIGILDVETVGSSKRLIGNLKVESDELGVLFGFENHSGRTYLGAGQAPLAKVMRGNGNNGEDKTEGARTNNVIGTYMHGPVLPNNPALADFLIGTAAKNRYGSFTEKPIDDALAQLARHHAENRKYY